MAILVDAAVLIEHLAKRTDLVRREIERGSPLVLSAVTRYEILCGSRKRPEKVLVELDRFPTRDVTAEVATRAGSLFRELTGPGGAGAIGDNDTLIAATALCHGDRVLTFDVDDFGRVPGLELVPLGD